VRPPVSDIDRFLSNVASSMETKYRGIFESIVLNHTTFKLSDLDLEMIKPIPQGGNWTNIPEETVKKSKRLMRISETGGRTTLYGRLAYNKPSYTITTYFNRPGNGTYVHPTHERVLSVREAARLQCFPDSYYFYGNKKDTLEQIGNAVPTLLAYNIGKSIKEKIGCSTSVDLFSGAGGLTYGFKLADIRALISNDFFEASCVTLKTNCPEIDVTCGDITDDNVKKRVIEAGIKGKADIICGGPPCQGFSLAGYRNADDPRNQMFRHFVEIVSKVNPKVVVFENVEGLMSFQGGKTYRNIISLFSELGYEAEGRLLHAVQYGAPQKRKRVIILCIRKDLKISPSDVYPKPITPEEENQITVKDTIFDLENVECSESARYVSDYSSPIIKFFKGEFGAEEYCKTIAYISQ
jgi:DNA (cytosine-5)-methyltransferase 1